jgi:hypothetical protein
MLLKPAILVSLLIAFSNAIAGPVTMEIASRGPLAILDGAGIGLVIWAVATWCFYTLVRTENSVVAQPLDLPAIGVAGTLVLIPSAMTSWIACFVISLWAFYRLKDCAVLKSVCLIFAALAMRVPITTLTLDTVSEEFLTVDAFLVQLALMLTPLETHQIGNIIVGMDGHKLAVMTGCSSFTNVSMALLAWFAITQATCHQISRRSALAGFGVAIAVVLLNVVRLSLMSVNAELYTYIHDGDGVYAFEMSLVIATLLITFIGIGGTDARSHDMDCSANAVAR